MSGCGLWNGQHLCWTPPECGRCFLADCVAIGSAWTATSPSPTTICSSGGGVGNCEDLINSRGAKVVLREEYFCVATSGRNVPL